MTWQHMLKLMQLPERLGIDFYLLKSRLSSIKQRPDKLFQDFVSRMTQTSNRLIGDTETGLLIVIQLGFENVNAI